MYGVRPPAGGMSSKSHIQCMGSLLGVSASEEPDSALAARTLHAMALNDASRYDEALSILSEVEADYRETQGEHSLDAAHAAARCAMVMYQRGDYEQAAATLEPALAAAREAPPGDHKALTKILNALAATCALRGDHERAAELSTEAIALQRSANRQLHPDLAESIYARAAATCVGFC